MAGYMLFHSLNTTVLRATLVVSSIIVIGDEFIIGLGKCGTTTIYGYITGTVLFLALCVAIMTYWALIQYQSAEKIRIIKKVLQMSGFTILLVISAISFYALGWVVYYSPMNINDAVREFINAALYDLTC